MSLLRVEQVQNGSEIWDWHTYKCDILGIEIQENWPHFTYNDLHISEEGMEKLVEDWIHRFVKYSDGGYPIVLSWLMERCAKRVTRNCYIPKELKQEVLRIYRHRCNNCGSKNKLEFDHIHPVSKGGLTELKNLQILCKTCNVKKSNKVLTEEIQ